MDDFVLLVIVFAGLGIGCAMGYAWGREDEADARRGKR